jgi:DNA-binding IclR family transcriptional regulator
MTEAERAGQSVEVLVKADEILELLRVRGEASVAQIAQGVGEPRSSIYRLIATLEDMGFVEQGATGGYQLGLRLHALGQIVADDLPIVDAARPALERLAAETGETIFLMVRDQMRAICLDRIEGTDVQSMAVEVGGTLPLHLGAGPLVLLAHAGDDVLDDYLAHDRLDAWTEESTTDPAILRGRIEEVRASGYSVSDQDLVPGIAAVGVPVRGVPVDGVGDVVAALSLSGPRASVVDDRLVGNVELLTAAAASIDAPPA